MPFPNTAKASGLAANPAVLLSIGLLNEFDTDEPGAAAAKQGIKRLYSNVAADLLQTVDLFDDDLPVDIGEFRNGLKLLQQAKNSMLDSISLGVEASKRARKK